MSPHYYEFRVFFKWLSTIANISYDSGPALCVIIPISSYLQNGTSGMAVMEIGFPSGFAAEKVESKNMDVLKRKEDGDRKVILYLDEVRIH